MLARVSGNLRMNQTAHETLDAASGLPRNVIRAVSYENGEHTIAQTYQRACVVLDCDGVSLLSNSDASANKCPSGVQDGSGSIAVSLPENIQVAGVFEEGGSGSVSPTPIEDVPQKGSTPPFRIRYVEDNNYHLPPAIIWRNESSLRRK